MSQTYDVTEHKRRETAIDAARSALGRGEPVVLPTDTVYGIGVDAFSPQAVAVLLAAKGRNRTMPPPVLIARAEVMDALATDIPEAARELAATFWPGGLTLILHAQPSLAWDLGETRGTVALRMPADEVALELLGAVGPMAVSSANRTGLPAATTAAAAQEMLAESVAVYLDDGERALQQASTIVDCTSPAPIVVRHGAIPLYELQAVVPEVVATE
ncbi:threonylcarbamoyl-AMP synthase [Nesterenkonia natronophila]|uniref:L-threonylcarbamoyladenylate synthase n=1 Tax=Nesterenkonia natronophila TaxID=2174932 RepID=A0A3A4F113_9MICC|nr:L-threonylcarbamoyladenylate synthase [Nesterenkonia natronophila]RJN31401.1 threonylcarbamoyl-AMP synthase [Nesterenkonia natronophila]